MSDLIDSLKKTMVALRELGVPPRHIHTIHDAIHALAAYEADAERRANRQTP